MIYFSLFLTLIYICMSDMETIENQIVSRDWKIIKQSNSENQLFTKRQKSKEAYSTLKILKIRDCISLQNALLVKDAFEEKISLFISYFKKLNTQHLHTTSYATNQRFAVPIVNIEIHSINSIEYRSVKIWNKPPDNLLNLTQPKTKNQLTNTFLKSYLSPLYNQKSITHYWSKASYLKFSLHPLLSPIFLLLLSTHSLLRISLVISYISYLFIY